MEYVNGEFIVKGCDENDPDCLRHFDDLINLVKQTGFLPLFSNEITGFSVEEHTTASSWWTKADTDPWVWRQLASAHPDIAYGRFFNRNAGFISKDWFPVFANYRRNGYDFDALNNDGLASNRSKTIMDAFVLDDDGIGKSLISSKLHELAGKDESILTQLQMQTYLIVSGFRQRKGSAGQEYGWHLSVYETPETKWGREFIASGYLEDPKESWNRITAHVKTLYPEMNENQIQKLFGIRYPGDAAARKKTTKKKEVKQKYVKPYMLPWPENLIMEIGLNWVFPEMKQYQELTDDQMAGLRYVIDGLKEKEQLALRLRYEEHKTLGETAAVFGCSKEQARRIAAQAVRKLRFPARVEYYRDGFEVIKKRLEELEAVQEAKRSVLDHILIDDSGLSVKTKNCLRKAGFRSLGDVAKKLKENPDAIIHIPRLGLRSYCEVMDKLESYGIDTSGV